MSRIIREIIKIYLYQNKIEEEVKNIEIMYLPDLSIFNFLSVFVLVQRILNYHPHYPTHRLYFGEVETHYRLKISSVRNEYFKSYSTSLSGAFTESPNLEAKSDLFRSLLAGYGSLKGISNIVQ